MPTEEFTGLKDKIWEQVWNQSRHLETMRSQYLGFFFTAALAVTAIAAKALADEGLRTTGSLIAFSTLLLGLEVLAAFLLVAIKRIGRVLEAYRTVVFTIRDESPDREKAWAQLPGPSGHRHASTQGAAEIVLYSALGVFFAALLAGAVRSVTVDVGSLTIVVCSVTCVLGLFVVAASVPRGTPRTSIGERPSPKDD